MATRFRFACEFCSARPGEQTERSLGRLLRSRAATPFADALPERWLVWGGGGALGPRRYACPAHRGELTAYLRRHYAGIHSCVWERPPYPQVGPGHGAPRHAAPSCPEPRIGAALRALSPFLAVADQPEPALDELLLALTAEFRAVDVARAHDRLDDFSRSLFGLGELDAAGQAGCVSHALRHELGLRCGDPRDPEAMFLDRVLERRRGHPLVLAVVVVEMARRAGATAHVCSAPTRLFAGFGSPTMRLVETTPPAGPPPPAESIVPHCPHAIAFGILDGLCDSLARMPGREGEAQHARVLQSALRDARPAP